MFLCDMLGDDTDAMRYHTTPAAVQVTARRRGVRTGDRVAVGSQHDGDVGARAIERRAARPAENTNT